MNINVELFKRYAPTKKLHIVNALSEQELLSVRLDTIIRIIKEVGYGSSGESRCHNKSLTLINKVGNHWNSDVESISLYKKVPYIYFYVQYSNTDTTDSDKLASFLGRGDYKGGFTVEDSFGNSKNYYYTYSEEDKANVIKSILLTYIHKKYNV